MNEFGLDSEKHIVGTTGDGASVMRSFGENIQNEYFQCNDHAIHLGVTKVLYQATPRQESESSENEEDFFVECEVEDIEPHDDIDDDDDDDDSTPIAEKYHPTLKKMRKIINHFRRSPVKNEVLQRFVFAEKKKQLKLIIDSKTRWGSLYDACSRFLDLLKPIKETFEQLEMTDNFLWTESDTMRLKVRKKYF